MYEIEIKTLLGSRERADELKCRVVELFPALKTLPTHKQRNHYFNIPKDLGVVERVAAPLYQSKEQREELLRILRGAKGAVSIRTRDADGAVLFVVKASIGDGTSANSVSRVEFEKPVLLTLEELDQKLVDAGLMYQAKWSREREHYDLGNINITIDKNAGYGYLAEFEKMIEDEREAEQAKQELAELMAQLGCAELLQDRLERMFKFYNEHWKEYYGTDKTFTIE